MTKNIHWFFAVLLLLYSGLYVQQEAQLSHGWARLQPVYPKQMYEPLGFLRQLGAELLYVKAAVFLGGRQPGTPPETYAPLLGQHFQVISDLHARFVDTYYLTESSISWVSRTHTKTANQVLAKGLEALPEQWVIPFFLGFNHFRYLDDPAKAADFLQQASRIPDAPKWLGHLAGILAAEGGDILGGLAWLRAMEAAETDPETRAIYQRDIEDFERALEVWKALKTYEQDHGEAPMDLQDLVPDYLKQLPQMHSGYRMYYLRPRLVMKRSAHE